MEIQRAFDSTQRLLPTYRRRYVMDAGFDDKQWFAHLQADEFVLRASPFERHTVATLSCLALTPFPRHLRPYG